MKKFSFKLPPGFGVRQPSGALVSQVSRLKSGRGLPQFKTLSRPPDGLNLSLHT
jgi:hypothetical protein